MNQHDFDGETYEPKHDKERLNTAMARVYRLMRDGKIRTLREIADGANTSEAGASARLRDLRKDRFAAFFGVTDVHAHRAENGVWHYQIETE